MVPPASHQNNRIKRIIKPLPALLCGVLLTSMCVAASAGDAHALSVEDAEYEVSQGTGTGPGTLIGAVEALEAWSASLTEPATFTVVVSAAQLELDGSLELSAAAAAEQYASLDIQGNGTTLQGETFQGFFIDGDLNDLKISDLTVSFDENTPGFFGHSEGSTVTQTLNNITVAHAADVYFPTFCQRSSPIQILVHQK